MDETIAKWLIEYLLRKKIDDNIINGVISSLPPVINDDRIKKTMLLRRIETETSNGCVSEQILEVIEIIDALDHEKGKTTSDLIKEAYCLVAVDCTVRFLSENVEENEKYMEKVETVWRNRVCNSERLVSEKSNEWLSDIEAAASDSSVYRKIWMRNTRNEALKAVKDYLREAWECLGLCLIELVAVKVENQAVEGDSLGNLCHNLAASVVEVENRRDRGANVLVPDKDAMIKDDVTSGTVRPGDVTPEVDSTEEAMPPSSVKQSVLSDHLSDDNQIAQTLSSIGNDIVVEATHKGPEILKSCEVARVRKKLEKDTSELDAAMSDHSSDDNRTAQTLSSIGNDNVVEANHNGPELLKRCEVAGVRKTLEKNTSEVDAAMSDHRSDDNPLAQTLSSTENNSVVEANHNETELLKSCEVTTGSVTQKNQPLTRRKHVAVKNRRDRGAKVLVPDKDAMIKDDVTYGTVRPGDITPKVDSTEELMAPSSVKQSVLSDHVSDDNQIAQTSSSAGNNNVVEADHNGPELLEVVRVRKKTLEKDTIELNAAVNAHLSDENPTGQTLSSIGNDIVVEATHKGPSILKRCEVAGVQKTLDKDTIELDAAMSDHRSDDNPTAQTLSSTENNTVVEANHNGLELFKSREVSRVRKALEINTRGLHAAVSDPLTEAQTMVDSVTTGSATQKNQPLTRRKHVAVKNRRNRGAKILVPDEDVMIKDDVTSGTVSLGDVTPQVDSTQKGMTPSSVKQSVLSDHVSDDNQIAQNLSSTGNNNVVEADHNGPELLKRRKVARVQKTLEKDTRELHAAVSDDNPTAQTLSSTEKNSVGEANHNGPESLKSCEALQNNTSKLAAAASDHLSDDNPTAQTLSSTGNNCVVEANHNGPVLHKSPEVGRVRKALKSNTRGLHAAVSDPLPEALLTAQTIVASMTTRSVLPTIPETDREQNAQKLPQKMETDKAGTETGAPQRAIENDSDKFSCGNVEKNVRKRSLMEANGTSHNYQWDDEIKNSSSASPSRPRLPSPKPLNISPLKIPVYRNFQRRRERKRWLPLEEDTLREGVKKYGRGNWKAILNDVNFVQVFQGRTEVDLKDKWRNLMR